MMYELGLPAKPYVQRTCNAGPSRGVKVVVVTLCPGGSSGGWAVRHYFFFSSSSGGWRKIIPGSHYCCCCTSHILKRFCYESLDLFVEAVGQGSLSLFRPTAVKKKTRICAHGDHHLPTIYQSARIGLRDDTTQGMTPRHPLACHSCAAFILL